MDSPRGIFAAAEMFEGLEDAELDRIYALTVQLDLPAGHVIFQENAREGDLYVLLTGTVDIRVNVPSEGRAESLAQVRKGDVFGEFALIDRSPRSASAVALSPVSLLQISRDDFLALCDEDPRIGYRLMTNLAGLLCRKLRETNMQWRNIIMYR